MIRIRDISLSPEHGEGQLRKAAAKALHVASEEIKTIKIARKSLDARKKDHIQWIYTLDVALRSGEDRALRRAGAKASPVHETHYQIPFPK